MVLLKILTIRTNHEREKTREKNNYCIRCYIKILLLYVHDLSNIVLITENFALDKELRSIASKFCEESDLNFTKLVCSKIYLIIASLVNAESRGILIDA